MGLEPGPNHRDQKYSGPGPITLTKNDRDQDWSRPGPETSPSPATGPGPGQGTLSAHCVTEAVAGHAYWCEKNAMNHNFLQR